MSRPAGIVAAVALFEAASPAVVFITTLGRDPLSLRVTAIPRGTLIGLRVGGRAERVEESSEHRRHGRARVDGRRG